MYCSPNLQSALVLICLLIPATLSAGERRKLIFKDDFNRNESQEKKDEVGNGWSTNSRSRAGGNKQVDLRNGALYIYRHKTADHGVSVRHAAEFKNGVVEIRFKLEHAKDTLGLNFADMKLKTVHAGHLFKVTVGLKRLEIADWKTGLMDLKIRKARKVGEVTPAMKKLLASKRKAVALKLETGKWYALAVNISGNTIRVALDKKEVAAFSSNGFAHPTKRMLRLAVRRNAVVDDLKIYSTTVD